VQSLPFLVIDEGAKITISCIVDNVRGTLPAVTSCTAVGGTLPAVTSSAAVGGTLPVVGRRFVACTLTAVARARAFKDAEHPLDGSVIGNNPALDEDSGRFRSSKFFGWKADCGGKNGPKQFGVQTHADSFEKRDNEKRYGGFAHAERSKERRVSGGHRNTLAFRRYEDRVIDNADSRVERLAFRKMMEASRDKNALADPHPGSSVAERG
jgi:hypothetical protein